MDKTAIPKDLATAIEFHGHLCPGLTIGYLAARIGLERLGVGRARDEELIAIVENDSCAVDAVQVMTSCTFGKGNLFFRDYGKMAFTFADRASGRAVRASLKTGILQDYQNEFQNTPDGRDRRIRFMLDQPVETLFSIRDEKTILPEPARIRESVICQHCGETVMETRVRRVGDALLCIPCAKAKAATTGTGYVENVKD